MDQNILMHAPLGLQWQGGDPKKDSPAARAHADRAADDQAQRNRGLRSSIHVFGTHDVINEPALHRQGTAQGGE
jgi:hypothetical protein